MARETGPTKAELSDTCQADSKGCMATKKTQIGFRVTDAFHKRIETECMKRGLSVQDLITGSLEYYFEEALNFRLEGMRVFVSYSSALDQILALRLQTMAAVYGMTVYVPPAHTRYATSSELLQEVQRQLTEAEVVLAVITNVPVESALVEMNYALRSGKLLIPIVSWTIPRDSYDRFPNHFVVDPNDPSQVEGEIVRFLAEKEQEKKTSGAGGVAILALATLAIALVLFGSESK